jgi:hypothetical protein
MAIPSAIGATLAVDATGTNHETWLDVERPIAGERN